MKCEELDCINSHSMVGPAPAPAPALTLACSALAFVPTFYLIRWGGFCTILKSNSNRNRKHFIPGYPNKILICSTNETYFEFQFTITKCWPCDAPWTSVENENGNRNGNGNGNENENGKTHWQDETHSIWIPNEPHCQRHLNRQPNHSIYVCDLAGINVIYFFMDCRSVPWCFLCIHFRRSGWEVVPFDLNYRPTKYEKKEKK